MSNQSILAKFSNQYSVEPAKMLETLKATAFKQSDGRPPTNEQMVALLVVADQYKLNPFTKEIYAFNDKNKGVIPIVGVDGWSRIINSNENLNGISFVYSDTTVEMSGAKTCPEWIECHIYRKDREHPIVVREYLDEVYRPSNKFKGPWQTHTKRFLRHKALIQCARIAFGFVGIYDEDEAQRIIESEVIDVTPKADDQEKQTFQSLINNNDSVGMAIFMKHIDESVSMDLYNSFPKGGKVEGKRQVAEMIKEGWSVIAETVDQIKSAVEENDLSSLCELVDEISNPYEMGEVKNRLNSSELVVLTQYIDSKEATHEAGQSN